MFCGFKQSLSMLHDEGRLAGGENLPFDVINILFYVVSMLILL